MSLPTGIGMTSDRTRARMVDMLRRSGIRDERVLAAMMEIPRHLFVEPGIASRAYEDTPLPIGHGQTTDEIVREVAWTGGRLATEQYDEFRLVVKLPETPGTLLAIPVLQECERGELRWTEVPAKGQPAHELKYPAPVLKLAPAGHAHH